jgi:hypothetical protein
MSKKTRKRTRKRNQPKTNNRFFWAMLGFAGLIVAIAAVVFQPKDYTVPDDYEPEVEGAPKLAVISSETVDYGDVKLGTTVETVFQIQNIGDENLHIVGEPVVELIEGC